MEGKAKVKGTEHNKAHEKLKKIEKVDTIRSKTNVTRQLVNELDRQRKKNEDDIDSYINAIINCLWGVE